MFTFLVPYYSSRKILYVHFDYNSYIYANINYILVISWPLFWKLSWYIPNYLGVKLILPIIIILFCHFLILPFRFKYFQSNAIFSTIFCILKLIFPMNCEFLFYNSISLNVFPIIRYCPNKEVPCKFCFYKEITI